MTIFSVEELLSENSFILVAGARRQRRLSQGKPKLCRTGCTWYTFFLKLPVLSPNTSEFL